MKRKILSISLFTVSILCFFQCLGQPRNYADYKIDVIPDKANFERLTEREAYIDSVGNKQYEMYLKMMMDGTAFAEGVSKEEKSKAIDEIKAKSGLYRYNRSRANLELSANSGEFKSVPLGGFLPFPCDCYLSNDTVKIVSNIGLSSGYVFKVDVVKNKFTSEFIEGADDEKKFKRFTNQKNFSTEIIINNIEQNLVLATKPIFSVGEIISGYLDFKTNDYYSKPAYKTNGIYHAYNGENLDKLSTKGVLWFKCQVRKRVSNDK